MSAESYLKSVYIDAKPIERGLQNKMVANYRDKIGPSAATPEHQPNIYIALDPPAQHKSINTTTTPSSCCKIPLNTLFYVHVHLLKCNVNLHKFLLS
jgi:hypothetical protein